MKARRKQLAAVLLTSALGAAGYVYYQAQERQAATLARIMALENCLIASNQQRAQTTKSTILGMSKTVRENRNLPMDVFVLQQAQELQGRTKAVLDTLHQLRQAWQAANHRQELRQLPAQLDQYVSFIQKFLPDVPAQLKSASWLADFDTAAESKPTALAFLTSIETQVQQFAAEALMFHAQKVGRMGDSFIKIGAVGIPASEMVAPGEMYQAQLFLGSSSSGRIHFSADGKELPLIYTTNRGLVRVKVPSTRPGQYDTMQAQWHGCMKTRWNAADTVLEITVPYFIVRPS
jgi:hypothetical protein